MIANKAIFLPMLMSMMEMAISDEAMLQKAKTFTKDGELIYELITDLMDTEKEGKEKYWINRLYGFIKQGAISMKDEDVKNVHKVIVDAIEKLTQEVKSKKKCGTVSFSLAYFKGEVYLQIAEVKAGKKKDGMQFNVISSSKLKNAIYAIINAVRQSDDMNLAWQSALSKVFPEFAIIKID